MYFEAFRLRLQQMKLPSDGWLLFSHRIKKKTNLDLSNQECRKHHRVHIVSCNNLKSSIYEILRMCDNDHDQTTTKDTLSKGY